MVKELRLEEKEWLEELGRQITRRSGPDRWGKVHYFSERGMTKGEWKRLTCLIQDHELPCRMCAGPYGFSVIVHEHGSIKDVWPDAVFGFEYHQAPGIQRGFGHQNEAAKKLSALTHTSRNQELLKWYGFQPLRRPEYYTY